MRDGRAKKCKVVELKLNQKKCDGRAKKIKAVEQKNATVVRKGKKVVAYLRHFFSSRRPFWKSKNTKLTCPPSPTAVKSKLCGSNGVCR
jgi:hypothetical protein